MRAKTTFIIVCIFLFTCLSSPTHAALHQVNTPVDVLIDVGHGGVDGGAVHGSVLEKTITLEVAKLLYAQLSMKGYSVVINRTKDYALSDDNTWLRTHSRHRKDLAQRKHLAKELSPKIMVSLHVNTSTNPSLHGPIVLYQKHQQSFLLADTVQHSLNQLFKTNELPQPGKKLYMLNHSICPTILVEMGFISNHQERQLMNSAAYQAQIANAINTAIDTYFLLLNHTPTADQDSKGRD